MSYESFGFRLDPGIIAVSYGRLGTAWTSEGAIDFAVAGRLRLQDKHERSGLPAVGDWVALRRPDSSGGPWLVQEILPRKTAFWRKMAGNAHKAQVVAANMDIIFVTTSLNRDFNSRRLERYLSLARESNARPIIILTKADLAGEDEQSYLEEAQGLDAELPVHSCSIVTGQGLDDIRQYLQPGVVVAFLGSSGVGKSSLINYFMGEERLRVNGLRNDDRGRHTTTHRELLRLPWDALVIDTPGMREVTLMDHNEGLEEAFEDLRELAEQCRFSDCQHNNEPGCAIQAAIESGDLDEDRLHHYRILKAEVETAEKKRLEIERRKNARKSPRR